MTGGEALEPQHPDAAAGQVMERRASGRAEPADDHVEMRHIAACLPSIASTLSRRPVSRGSSAARRPRLGRNCCGDRAREADLSHHPAGGGLRGRDGPNRSIAAAAAGRGRAGGRHPGIEARRAGAAVGLPPAPHAGARGGAVAAAVDRPERMRGAGRGAARGRDAARQDPRCRDAAGDPALHLGRGDRAMGARGRGAGGARARGPAQEPRQLRVLRLPRAQSDRRRQALRARQGQRARHALAAARRRQGGGADRSARGQGFSRGVAESDLRALQHRAGTGLRRLSREPRARGPRRAQPRQPHVPMGGARAGRATRRRRAGAAAAPAAVRRPRQPSAP